MDCNFNRVRLCGRISSDPALSHVNHGETFYRFVLSVQRLSGQCDDLPVIVPRQLLRACPLGRGDAAARPRGSCARSTTAADRDGV